MSVIRPAIVVFILLTLVAGVIYPALVTVVAQIAFSRQANGSIIERSGKPVGSSLIGQNFSGPGYFWPRPSNAGRTGYDATSGSGSNLAPSNPALADAVKQRIAALRAADPGNVAPVPIELVTASASGLDAHISVAAAEFQAGRVARVRRMDASAVRKMIDDYTEGRTLGVLGEPRVNVVRLNTALDAAGSLSASR